MTRARTAALASACAGLGLLSPVFLAAPAHAASYNFGCYGIAPIEGYEPCTGDRWSVGSGRFVRIENVSAGNKSVTFKIYNSNGHHLLGTTPKLTVGSTGFGWRNDTAGSISIDVEADPDACCVTVDVNARAYITTT